MDEQMMAVVDCGGVQLICFCVFFFSSSKLLQASIRANKTGHFYWIGSDSWGAKVYPVREQEYAAVNTITILPYRTNLEGFDDYFKSLRPKMDYNNCNTSDGINYYIKNPPTTTDDNDQEVEDEDQTTTIINCRNIWFRKFWAQHHKCTFDKNDDNEMRICTGNEESPSYEQEGLVPFVGKFSQQLSLISLMCERHKRMCVNSMEMESRSRSCHIFLIHLITPPLP